LLVSFDRSWLREKPEELEKNRVLTNPATGRRMLPIAVAGFVRSRKNWRRPGSHEPSYEDIEIC